MKKLLASLGSTCIVGYIPVAPGTWGSLLALGTGFLIVDRLGWFEMCFALLAAFVLGTMFTRRYLEIHPERIDPKEVVIDEVAGQWLTLLVPILLLHLGAWMQTGQLNPIVLEADWVGIYYGLAFVFFRLFDIVKPWPVSFFDRKMKGALGVMLDDIAAGCMAGILLYVVYITGPMLIGDMGSNI